MGATDAFLTAVDMTSGALIFSTYWGGTSFDEIRAIAIDSAGRIVTVGMTSSLDFPLLQSAKPSLGGIYDGFVTRWNSSLNLELSAYIGGSGSDATLALAVVGTKLYFAGQTQSFDLPAVSAFQTSNAGSSSGFWGVFSDSACNISLGTPTTSVGAGGGIGSFNVVIAQGCAWTATSDAPWLVVTSGSNGVGPGSVSYSLGRNSAATSRVAHITIQGSP
jgi:hypothetical protein